MLETSGDALPSLLHDSSTPALVDPDAAWVLTHGDLREVVDELAGALHASGLQEGDGVAIVVENSIAAVAAFLGVTRAACVAMPVNPQLREREIATLFEDKMPAVVVVGEDGHDAAQAAARAASVPVRVLTTGPRPSLSGAGGGTSPADPDSEAIALLLHTSGTTSRPKVVPLRHRNLAASARGIAAGYGLGADDISYCMMPLFHVHGLVASTLATLAAGGCVVVPRRLRPSALWRHVAEHRVTWFSAVPTILAKLPTSAAGDSGSLRFARSCSSALAPPLWEQLEERFRVPLVEAYGMTEASHQMASNPLPPDERRAGTVGLPTGADLAIFDADWRALPPGEAGEVVVRGQGVVDGYLANPEANAASFRDGWFRTGDVGRLSADGYLSLDGRIKELINRGGEKIAPREVDEALLAHPGVREAVAYGVADAKWGEEVHAAVVVDGQVDEAELRRFCGEHLAPFKVPRRVSVVEEIPKGPTGKVQRRLLASMVG